MPSRLAALLTLCGIAHSVTIEFYWTKPSKISTTSLEELLLQEIHTYCNATISARDRCLLPSSGYVGGDSVILSDPVQSGTNVAVDIDARYTNNMTYHFISDSFISAMMMDEKVRTRVSDGIGYWIEQVDKAQYRVKADQQLNISISISVSVFTFLLLVVALLLRKREEDQAEEQRKQQRRSIKKTGERSYKVRPGPEPIEKWPSIRHGKGPDSNKISPEPTVPAFTFFGKEGPENRENLGKSAQSHTRNGMTGCSAIPGLSKKLPPLVESDVSGSPSLEHSSRRKAKKRKQKLEENREKTTSEKVVEITELENEEMPERENGNSNLVTEDIGESGVSNEGYNADVSQL